MNPLRLSLLSGMVIGTSCFCLAGDYDRSDIMYPSYNIRILIGFFTK